MPKTLLDTIIKEDLITSEQAEELEEESRASQRPIEDLILERKLIEEGKLYEAKSKVLNIPLKRLAPGEEVSPTVLREIPEDTARFYKIVPLARTENTFEVGMLDPEDFRAKEALKFIGLRVKAKIKIFLIKPSDFHNILTRYRTLAGEVTRALEELKEELAVPAPGEEMIGRIAEEAPITKIVAVLLRHAIEGRASDIHIEPTRDTLRVRFRMDGVLYTSLILPLNIHPAVIARIKILANLKIDETRIPQDGRFEAKIGDRNIDFRISVFPTIFGEKAAMRVLDPRAFIKTLDELGFEGRNLEVVKRELQRPYRMILVTGPTGCGKSTSLYVMINNLQKEAVNIVTLEDPIEYIIEGVNQSQIRPELGYTFASGLRYTLRQDPDVIMVGEIRDEETAALAIHSALTGHLVFSTLHTNDALGAIPRLIDMKISPFLIPNALAMVIAQRLIQRLCQECKEKVKPNPAIEDLVLKELEALPSSVKKEIKIPSPLYFYRAPGCKLCASKGTRGRIGIFEVLFMTKELERIVMEKPSREVLMEEWKRQGMITMKQDGILKALQGIVTIEEVLKAVE